MKHLLIAGGTGFIGYHLSLKFKKAGWKVTSLYISKPKKKRLVKGINYIKIDLTNSHQIKRKLQGKFTHVVNLSGHTRNLYLKKFKKKIYESHFLGTKNLINFFLNKKINSFVQIGSSAEYGNHKDPQKESDLCRPKNIYGKSKLKATKYALKTFYKFKFPVNVLRLFQVYGPLQGDNRVVSQLMRYCIQNKKFPTSDGKQVRDFCYVDDVVRAIYLLLKKNNIFGKIINIGYGKGTTIKNLIVNIQKVTKGGKPQYGLFKLRNHENPVLVPSISLAKKTLHWQPKINLADGLRKTKNSLIKNG